MDDVFLRTFGGFLNLRNDFISSYEVLGCTSYAEYAQKFYEALRSMLVGSFNNISFSYEMKFGKPKVLWKRYSCDCYEKTRSIYEYCVSVEGTFVNTSTDNIIIPEWKMPKDIPQNIRDAYELCRKVVENHEEGHRKQFEEQAKRLTNTFIGIGVGCSISAATIEAEDDAKAQEDRILNDVGRTYVELREEYDSVNRKLDIAKINEILRQKGLAK